MENSRDKKIWNRRKGELKNYEEELSDDDFIPNEHREDELIRQVQQRLGVTREEAKNIIRNSGRI